MKKAIVSILSTILISGNAIASDDSEIIAPARTAGELWVNDLGMAFRWSPPSAQQAGFWVAQYETTLATVNRITPFSTKHGIASLPRHPRDGLRYQDILQFIELLNTQQSYKNKLPKGWRYALPTKTQWEYAARAGERNDQAKDLSSVANFADRQLLATQEPYFQYAVSEQNDGTAKLAEVGSYAANAWGLQDMLGNVWEWTATTDTLRGKPVAIAKGCSWASLPEYCNIDFDHRFQLDTEKPFIGFRLILGPVETN